MHGLACFGNRNGGSICRHERQSWELPRCLLHVLLYLILRGRNWRCFLCLLQRDLPHPHPIPRYGLVHRWNLPVDFGVRRSWSYGSCQYPVEVLFDFCMPDVCQHRNYLLLVAGGELSMQNTKSESKADKKSSPDQRLVPRRDQRTLWRRGSCAFPRCDWQTEGQPWGYGNCWRWVWWRKKPASDGARACVIGEGNDWWLLVFIWRLIYKHFHHIS